MSQAPRYTMSDKEYLFEQLRVLVGADAASVGDAQRTTQESATHPESRPENDKDTRALESTYLSRGLSERADRLRKELALLESIRLRAFGPEDPIALTALVVLHDEDNDIRQVYFLSPAGGGAKIQVGSDEVSVISSNSPIGQALIGKVLDDDTRVKTPQGFKLFSIIEVC